MMNKIWTAITVSIRFAHSLTANFLFLWLLLLLVFCAFHLSDVCSIRARTRMTYNMTAISAVRCALNNKKNCNNNIIMLSFTWNRVFKYQVQLRAAPQKKKQRKRKKNITFIHAMTFVSCYTLVQAKFPCQKQHNTTVLDTIKCKTSHFKFCIHAKMLSSIRLVDVCREMTKSKCGKARKTEIFDYFFIWKMSREMYRNMPPAYQYYAYCLFGLT